MLASSGGEARSARRRGDAAFGLFSFFSDGMLSTRSRSRGRTFTCSPGFWYFVSRRSRCVSAIAAMIATSRITAAISNG